jgi:SAM-dependent methyltransferase
MSTTDATITYYDNHGPEFVQATVGVDMSQLQLRFVSALPAGGSVLDAGCGSGRDGRAFMDLGFNVMAFDASETMVAAATSLGVPTRQLRFQEFDAQEAFDGIWASASLLHVSLLDLEQVVSRLLVATRPGGVIYASFKYGEGERSSHGRLFTDFTPTSWAEWLTTRFSIVGLETWVTEDVRLHRANELWVNTTFRKPLR